MSDSPVISEQLRIYNKVTKCHFQMLVKDYWFPWKQSMESEWPLKDITKLIAVYIIYLFQTLFEEFRDGFNISFQYSFYLDNLKSGSCASKTELL